MSVKKLLPLNYILIRLQGKDIYLFILKLDNAEMPEVFMYALGDWKIDFTEWILLFINLDILE